MFLKSLEVQGFKSFPDRTFLTFGKGITAVVGPNGSGKSNISDAVSWVLGEQSVRQLRGDKMEDVVFTGTAKRKGLGFAQVSLVIDNNDRRLPYDSDEIKVTRKYYRSGESEYLINGNSVRLKDINELFMDTGLGRDGYSIIGQGRIADIVSSKPQDRREIFEEAAGIAKYRYRKTEAERRLNQAQENLLRLRDIMSELESRLEPLKEQSEKAEEFIKLSEEKRSLEIGLWMNTLHKSKDFLEQQENKIAMAKAQYERSESELNAIEEEIENIYSKTQEILSQIDEIRRDSANLEEEATRKEGEINVLKNDIFHNNVNIARIEAEIQKGSLLDSDIEKEISAKEAEKGDKESFIEEQKNLLESNIASLKGLQEESEKFSGKIEELAVKLNNLSLENANLRVVEMTSASSASEIVARMEAIDNSIAGKRQQIEDCEKELKECIDAIDACNEHIDSLSNSIKGYEFKLNARRQKLDELKKEHEKIRLEAEQKKRQADLLEDLERNLEGFAHSVKSVLQNAERGLLKGIHGPLSRLITVPLKYNTAIETALGSAMQNIVVDTENDAKQAIEFLKAKNAGRATFLPLTTIKGNTFTEKGLEDCPGFVGIASGLVEYDKKYENIVSSTLGRIVVADNLNNAISIAKKFAYRFRIVTLDGQVINAGGSFTGGSGTKSSGLLGRTVQIKELRDEAVKLLAKAETLGRSLREAEQEVSKINAELEGIRAELTTSGEDKIRFEAEKRRLEELITNANTAINELNKERESAVSRLAELDKEKAQAKEKMEEIALQTKAFESELSELTSNRQGIRAKREELTNAIEQLRLTILSAEKDLQAIYLDIDELRSKKSGFIEQQKTLEQEKSELIKKNDDTSLQIEEIKNQAARLREEAKASIAKIEELSSKRLQLEGEISNLRKESRDKSAERESIGRELSRLEERKVSAQKEYDEIIGRLWDEYELTRSEAETIGEQIQNVSKAQRRLNELKAKIRNLGAVNVAAIEEYKEVKERYEFMTGQLEDIEKSRQELIALIDDLTNQMSQLFITRFEEINRHFGEIFRELFGGGNARLYLSQPDDILSSGIEIQVQPPGKIINNLNALSGGEKALVAISIYFAILKVNPAPFCVLDEIEAPLDEVNVDRFASFLRRMSDNTQFIIITHRRGTMEEADVLYGVTMQEEGVSKLLELRINDLEKKLDLIG